MLIQPRKMGFDKPMYDIFSLLMKEDIPYFPDNNINLKSGTAVCVADSDGHDYSSGEVYIITIDGDKAIDSDGEKLNRLPLKVEDIKDKRIRVAEKDEILEFLKFCDLSVLKYIVEMI